MKAKEYWENYSIKNQEECNRVTASIEHHQQKIINSLIGNPEGLMILKTDLWNEAIRHGCFNIEDYLTSKEFTGIDISENICRLALKRNNGLAIIKGEIPFILNKIDDSYFDLILDISTLDHIKRYRDTIKQYSRILKHKGRLLIIWNKYNPLANFYVYVRKLSRGIFPVKHPYHYQYTINDIFNLLKKNNFTILKEGPWNYPFSSFIDGFKDWHYMNHWVLAEKGGLNDNRTCI